jgi:hypothetical protein
MARFNLLSRRISTEQAAVSFGILAGVGGTLAQLVAGKRLSDTGTDTIPLRNLLIPTIVGGGSTLAAAFLVPTDG